MVVNKKPILAGLCFISAVFFAVMIMSVMVGASSADTAADGAENESVVHTELNSVQISDVEKTEDELVMTVVNTDNSMTTVRAADRASEVSQDVYRVDDVDVTYTLSGGESTTISIDWESADGYGYWVVVDDGQLGTSITQDPPTDDRILADVGSWTWVGGVVIGLMSVAIAGFYRKYKEESQPHRVI